jgi:hypothetical protein
MKKKFVFFLFNSIFFITFAPVKDK